MRVFLFLNLSRALTGSLTSPNAWDVNRVEVSRNAPSDNALPSDKLYDALNAQSRKAVSVIISLRKDTLVEGFTYTVSRSEWDHEGVGIVKTTALYHHFLQYPEGVVVTPSISGPGGINQPLSLIASRSIPSPRIPSLRFHPGKELGYRNRVSGAPMLRGGHKEFLARRE